MSSENSYLVLRLEGPLQTWGFDSQYNRRNTGLMPTKSAIAGMCCAALGYLRGSDDEKVLLYNFVKVRMMAIAIPRVIKQNVGGEIKIKELKVRRLQDYHTVLQTRKADGGIKDCHITNRQYLTDAAFGVILVGDGNILKKLSEAIANPVWGLWLGRKTCIPTAPILGGLVKTKNEALKLLRIENINNYTWQEDVENFADGGDSLPDTPVSFATEKRLFSPRRIVTNYALE